MFETIIKCRQPVYTFSDELKKMCPKKSVCDAVAILFSYWNYCIFYDEKR